MLSGKHYRDAIKNLMEASPFYKVKVMRAAETIKLLLLPYSCSLLPSNMSSSQLLFSPYQSAVAIFETVRNQINYWLFSPGRGSMLTGSRKVL